VSPTGIPAGTCAVAIVMISCPCGKAENPRRYQVLRVPRAESAEGREREYRGLPSETISEERGYSRTSFDETNVFMCGHRLSFAEIVSRHTFRVQEYSVVSRPLTWHVEFSVRSRSPPGGVSFAYLEFRGLESSSPVHSRVAACRLFTVDFLFFISYM